MNNDQHLLSQFYKTMQKLQDNWDQSRLDYSKALLAIYTPVVSGMFFIADKATGKPFSQRAAFLFVAMSAAAIVASVIIERFAYYLISEENGRKYLEEFKKTNQLPSLPMNTSRRRQFLAAAPLWIMTGAFFINIVAVVVYIFLTV